jgi:hypothetical protein
MKCASSKEEEDLPMPKSNGGALSAGNRGVVREGKTSGQTYPPRFPARIASNSPLGAGRWHKSVTGVLAGYHRELKTNSPFWSVKAS